MLNRSMFSSQRGDWKTPTGLLEDLTKEFGEQYDVSDTHNGEFDAFRDEWPSPWFCNPPYGREIGKWTSQFSQQGMGIALLPSRTDTKWFQEDILNKASEIRFIRGRLKFDDCENSAPFPSVLAVFGTHNGMTRDEVLAEIMKAEDANQARHVPLSHSTFKARRGHFFKAKISGYTGYAYSRTVDLWDSTIQFVDRNEVPLQIEYAGLEWFGVRHD